MERIRSLWLQNRKKQIDAKLLWTTDRTLITSSHCIFFNDAYQNTIIRELALPLPKSINSVLKESQPIGCIGIYAAHSFLPAASLLPWWLCAMWCVVQCVGQLAAVEPLSGLSMRLGRKISGFTVVLLTSTLTWELVCLHWKRLCYTFHQFIDVDSKYVTQEDIGIRISVAL